MPREIRQPKKSPEEMDAYARLKRSHPLLKEEHEILAVLEVSVVVTL